jgi:hypothetical protein
MSVAQVLSTTPLNVSFRRALVGDNWDKWLHLVESVLMVYLNDHRDSFRWTASKIFSVINMYNDLIIKSGTPVNCCTWKAKIPLKIKIFLWYLKNGVVLTKDNLVKNNGRGVLSVAFVQSKKLFSTCSLIVPWLDLCGGLFFYFWDCKTGGCGTSSWSLA